MQGVKEAILLLKQYGTPVFASALTAAKFTAWAGIIGGSVVAILAMVVLWLVLPKLADEEAYVEGNVHHQKVNNQGPRMVAWGVAGFVMAFAICFAIGGVYDLVSLDYQAYKLMLFK